MHQQLTSHVEYNPKIKKYLDDNGRYSPLKSEVVRQAYKDTRVNNPISHAGAKLINSIFIQR